MFSLSGNIFIRAAGTAILATAPMALAAAILGACSAAPVKMECREIQMRIDYGDLSQDQLRFAMQELEECRRKLRSAEARDSAFIDGAEQRFTPAEE